MTSLIYRKKFKRSSKPSCWLVTIQTLHNTISSTSLIYRKWFDLQPYLSEEILPLATLLIRMKRIRMKMKPTEYEWHSFDAVYLKFYKSKAYSCYFQGMKQLQLSEHPIWTFTSKPIKKYILTKKGWINIRKRHYLINFVFIICLISTNNN